MTASTELPAAELSTEAIAAAVRRYGLQRAGARPPLLMYTRQLWARRHFITAFARADNAVGFSTSFLGQAWQLLTPLLNVGVYYVIFGVLLHTDRGVHNYVAFLVIGVFVFTYPQTAMVLGSQSLSGREQLTRALRFPRAVLPVAATIVALLQFLASLLILVPTVLLTGEHVSARWLLLVPATVLQTCFALGLALVVARLGSKVPDTSQLLPFLLRTWMFASGVFYSITAFSQDHAHWVLTVLEWNPAFVYIDLVREALLEHQPHPAGQWWLAAAWAAVILVGGYVFFWRAEERYGRD